MIFSASTVLSNSCELVQGCRLPAGGGRVMPGAMPFLHRWLGNPLFFFLAHRWFGVPSHDVYCGLRGFSRKFYGQLNMRCTGMEFAVEMIIKASLIKARIGEVPITLRPDGRANRKPHMRTFRDGWRTLCFLLLYGAKRLFSFNRSDGFRRDRNSNLFPRDRVHRHHMV